MVFIFHSHEIRFLNLRSNVIVEADWGFNLFILFRVFSSLIHQSQSLSFYSFCVFAGGILKLGQLLSEESSRVSCLLKRISALFVPLFVGCQIQKPQEALTHWFDKKKRELRFIKKKKKGSKRVLVVIGLDSEWRGIYLVAFCFIISHFFFSFLGRFLNLLGVLCCSFQVSLEGGEEEETQRQVCEFCTHLQLIIKGGESLCFLSWSPPWWWGQSS